GDTCNAEALRDAGGQTGCNGGPDEGEAGQEGDTGEGSERKHRRSVGSGREQSKEAPAADRGIHRSAGMEWNARPCFGSLAWAAPDNPDAGPASGFVAHWA